MFKLIKIINSGKSAPEIVKIKVYDNSTYYAGALYYVNDSGLSKIPALEDDCKFIPITTCTAGGKNDTVTGYIVSEDMLFETEHPDPSLDLTAGNSFSFRRNPTGLITGMSETPGADIKLINTDSVLTTGKISVLLKW